MLLIYATSISNRLRYICHFLWGENAVLTDDWAVIDHSELPKINYSDTQNKACIWIQPCGLLEEKGIHKKEHISLGKWEEMPVLFAQKEGFPFDILAASFYLITRYEEYFPAELDKFGRYAHTESVAFQNDFLHLPMVDIWLNQFHIFIQKTFPQYQPPTIPFSYKPTFDIDVAFKYKFKPLWRQVLKSLQNIYTGHLVELKGRIKVRCGNQKDPYDIYTELLENVRHWQPIFFFPLANKIKANDRNLPPRDKRFQQFIRQIASRINTGIHPSWQSGDHPALLTEEIRILEEITCSKVMRSRQHYIRMRLPETYHLLITNGILEDYSMGYPTRNGFRASTSRPFYWYDLTEEKTTGLLIHPFAFMDANSKYQLHQSPEEAAQELEMLYRQVQKSGGQFISVHHNEFFTELPEFEKWRAEMYVFWKGIKNKG